MMTANIVNRANWDNQAGILTLSEENEVDFYRVDNHIVIIDVYIYTVARLPSSFWVLRCCGLWTQWTVLPGACKRKFNKVLPGKSGHVMYIKQWVTIYCMLLV